MMPNAQPRPFYWPWNSECRVKVVGRVARAAGLVLGLTLGSTGLIAAQETAQEAESGRPVVLELFTAQGCASCPAADEMLLALAQREDVIALSLHVDYWDYIGWVDSFGDPKNTHRQQNYARRQGYSTIYTPQVVINGQQIIDGFQVMRIMEAITAQRARAPEVLLRLERRDDGTLRILARPSAQTPPVAAMASRRSATPNAVVGTLSMGDAAPMAGASSPSVIAPRPSDEAATVSIEVIRYLPRSQVQILAGENAGRSAQFANIVTDWQVVGTWDLAGPLEMNVPLEGNSPVVVIIQEAGQGEIISAARLR
jgi:hypothetical protein